MTTSKYIYELDPIDLFNFNDPSCKKISISIKDSNGLRLRTGEIQLNQDGYISQRRGYQSLWTVLPSNITYRAKKSNNPYSSMPLLYKYIYDSQNRLIKITSTVVDTQEVFSKFDLHYESSLLTQSKYTEQINSSPILYTEKYFYDTDSKLIKRTNTKVDSDKNTAIKTEEFLFDSENKVTSKLTSQSVAFNKKMVVEIEWRTEYSYNENGQLIKALDLMKDEESEQVRISTFSYTDSSGDKIHQIFSSSEAQEKTKIQFTYDAKNRIEKVSWNDLLKNLVSETYYSRE